MIEIISNITRLNEFKEIWEDIYQQDINASPFQSFEYIASSIKLLELDSSLFILAIKDDSNNKWIAFFPFNIDHKRNLRFINSAHSDFCDILILPEYDNYRLYKQVSNFINDKPEVKGLILENLKSSSHLFGSLKQFYKYSILQDYNYYPTISIKRDIDENNYLSCYKHLPALQKRNLKKAYNLISRDHKFEIISYKENNVFPYEDIKGLATLMITKGIRSSNYFSHNFLGFFRELYINKVIDIALLYENNVLKACYFILPDSHKKEIIEWILLYDDKKWNLIISVLINEYLYNSGGGILNFGRGIYDYKLNNFHPKVHPLFCLKIAKTRRRHLWNILTTSIHYLKPIVKSFLNR